IEGPFSIVSVPPRLSPLTRGPIVVRSDGSPGRTGRLILRSDDPRRPRIEVALSSLLNGQASPGDWQRHTGDIPLVDGEQIVALYSTTRTHEDRGFPYALGQPPLAWAAAHTPRAKAARARYLGEAELRRRESELARKVAAAGGLGLFQPTASQAEIGDQRGFTFDQFGRVATQRVPATVLAVSQYGVAWGHDGSGAGGTQLPTARIQEILNQFDADFDLLVTSLGVPSDVDGDGKTHFLFTPLVDSTGFGGFVDAASILPFATGGNGNQTDLIFISLGEPDLSYRSLLAHEFQHLINFNQHVLVRFGDSEVSWLNEGLSHVAEDLVGGHRVGNADRVATYLADPTTVGLVGDASTSSAKRGGAYLFVRALVDRFGRQVLLALIGTGRADRDNLQYVTQEAFEDLLANFAAQLATSGTDLGQHPRFDFTFDALAPEGRRGFGPPQMARFEASAGFRGTLPAGGVSFHRVHAQGATSLPLEVDPAADVRALVIPVPSGYEIPVVIAADFFRHVTLDASLSATVRSGEAIRVAGRIDPALFPAGSQQREFVLEYQEADVFPSFSAPINGDRFERDIVFSHPQQGEFSLAAFARWLEEDEYQFEWLGSFAPARVLAGQGIVQLPRRFFDRLLVDQPWPTAISPDGTVELGGMVMARADAPPFVLIQVDLAGADDTLSVPMDVVGGRFDGRLTLVDQPTGSYSLNVFGQTQEGDFLWLGGSDYVEVRQLQVTAIVEAEAVAPTAALLGDNFPNPFNSHTVIPFHLPVETDATVTIFNVAGQKVAQWQVASLSAGAHRWHWDARSTKGEDLASGLYVVQLQTRDQRLHRKLLLLR
ncbi:MAG: T9SS type A sorting domain-containing protein, partial [Gemmatimonadetes bacterium]|nr:T9SS type A sorting domain-containing protein [Gemmatimonadota bacterium]